MLSNLVIECFYAGVLLELPAHVLLSKLYFFVCYKAILHKPEFDLGPVLTATLSWLVPNMYVFFFISDCMQYSYLIISKMLCAQDQHVHRPGHHYTMSGLPLFQDFDALNLEDILNWQWLS